MKIVAKHPQVFIIWPQQVRKNTAKNVFQYGKSVVIADILRKFYDILNSKCSFGSRKNAEYAEESLGWVLKDKGG